MNMALYCTLGRWSWAENRARSLRSCSCCSSFHSHVQGSRYFIFLSIKEHLGNDCLGVTQTPLTGLCPLFQRASTQPHSHRQEDRIRSHYLLWKHTYPGLLIFSSFPQSLWTAGSMSHTGTRVWISCGYPVTSYCVLPPMLKLFSKILACFHVQFLCPLLPLAVWVGGRGSDRSCLNSGVGRTLASFCVYNWIYDSSCESLSSTFLLQLLLPAALAPGTNL